MATSPRAPPSALDVRATGRSSRASLAWTSISDGPTVTFSPVTCDWRNPLGRRYVIRTPSEFGGSPMAEVTYEIVEHDGGWAYKVDGVFSEPYPTHADALAAAQAAAEEQRVPGHTETIEYEDDKGRWHTETARG